MTATETTTTIDWQARALAHAIVVRALLAVRQPESGTAGARWLDEANETLRVAGYAPGVGVGPGARESV